MASNHEKPKASIFSKLRQIKIEGPVDFSENLDLYLKDENEEEIEMDSSQPAVGEELAALLDEIAALPYTPHPDGQTDVSTHHDEILYPK